MQTEIELVEMIEEDLKYEYLYYEEIVTNLYD